MKVVPAPILGPIRTGAGSANSSSLSNGPNSARLGAYRHRFVDQEELGVAVLSLLRGSPMSRIRAKTSVTVHSGVARAASAPHACR